MHRDSTHESATLKLMRVFAQALDLKDDPALIAEYVALHREVWPEVTQSLRKIGITSMRIYRGGTRLFMVIEADDEFDVARYQAYAQEPRTGAWDALTRRFQQPTPFAQLGEWWSPLEEIFDLNANLGTVNRQSYLHE